MSNKKCEWEWKKLGDVSKIYNGNSINEKVKKERYSDIDEGYPFIATKDVSFNGDVDYDNGIRIPYSEDNFKTANSDTVLICAEGGSAGRKKCILNQRVCFGNKLFAIDSNKELLKGKFVFYYVHHEFFLNEFKKLMAGIIGGVSSAKFKEILIPVPPLAEQERIVNVLDDAFAKIDKIKTDAETNLQNAKDLFQTTLANELSITDEKIKQGWEEVSLEDCCEIKSALVDPKEKQYQQLLHIGGANIESEKGSLIDLKTAEEEKLISGKFLFDESMILYSKIRPYLKKIVRPTFSGLCSADIYPLSTLKNMDKNYLYYVLYSEPFTDYANKNSARAGMPKLNRESLFAYSFLLPPLSIQKQIVAKLDSLSEKIKQLESNYKQVIADCDELKKSILKKAFNGEL